LYRYGEDVPKIAALREHWTGFGGAAVGLFSAHP
jgi:hypothetical protein